MILGRERGHGSEICRPWTGLESVCGLVATNISRRRRSPAGLGRRAAVPQVSDFNTEYIVNKLMFTKLTKLAYHRGARRNIYENNNK